MNDFEKDFNWSNFDDNNFNDFQPSFSENLFQDDFENKNDIHNLDIFSKNNSIENINQFDFNLEISKKISETPIKNSNNEIENNNNDFDFILNPNTNKDLSKTQEFNIEPFNLLKNDFDFIIEPKNKDVISTNILNEFDFNLEIFNNSKDIPIKESNLENFNEFDINFNKKEILIKQNGNSNSSIETSSKSLISLSESNLSSETTYQNKKLFSNNNFEKNLEFPPFIPFSSDKLSNNLLKKIEIDNFVPLESFPNTYELKY